MPKRLKETIFLQGKSYKYKNKNGVKNTIEKIKAILDARYSFSEKETIFTENITKDNINPVPSNKMSIIDC